jgi:hypothetical protein
MNKEGPPLSEALPNGLSFVFSVKDGFQHHVPLANSPR